MSNKDHILSIVKAGTAAIPIVGGPIASLIGDYIPTATERSIQEALRLLGARIVELEDRIDVESMNKDQFSELFKSNYYIIVRTHQKEKLQCAVNLIANILLKDGDPDKLSYTELDHFTRCLESLSSGAVEVLTHISVMAEVDSKRYREERVFRFEFRSLHSKMSNIDADFLMGLISELNSHNFLHIDGVPSIRTENYGNYSMEFTSLGRRFVDHILATSTSSG